jgi:hypothetical protein
MSLGFWARYAGMSCVNRHLYAKYFGHSRRKRRKRTHSAPNSHVRPAANLQHKFRSSCSLFHRRPLFAPFFRLSSPRFRRWAPLASPEALASSTSVGPGAEVMWFVELSAMSSSAVERFSRGRMNLSIGHELESSDEYRAHMRTQV